MCGIFGLISEDWQLHAESAARRIAHRGPDDYGVYRQNKLCLIHYRLSILDVSDKGHQPMISEDGRYVIILNGEIYNHPQIRLEYENYNFKSTSDTETILCAFSSKGTDLFAQLNGIFTIAIYDKQRNELIIARDQLGVKPLYYHLSEKGFVFSSELKSIIPLDGIDKLIDTEAIYNYIQFIYSPGNKTPIRSIHKLEAGHYIRISVANGELIEFKKYYQIPFTGNYIQRSESEWIDAIDLALQNAVKRQLLSDVPVGYFISGGLDSSLIAAIARKLNPSAMLTGFTIANPDIKSYDGFVEDYPYAKRVAELFDINLNVVDGKLDLFGDLDKMIWQQDEPLAELSALYVSSIAKIARKNGIKVLLSGLGGDDLFAGYRRHQAARFDKNLYSLPFVIRKAAAGLSKFILTNNATSRRLKKFLEKFEYRNIESGIVNYNKWLPDGRVFELFTESHKDELKEFNSAAIFLKSLSEIPAEKNPLNQLLYLDMHFFLPDFNLIYTDKMSMQHAVEVRVPFLDQEIVALSTQIPPQLKIKKGIPKYLLKKLAERYLPHDIIYRSKTGFSGPVRKWIKADFAKQVQEALNREAITTVGLFDFDQVQKLIEENAKGSVDASYSILSILAIQSWMKQFKSV